MKQPLKLLFVSPLAERSGAPLVLATLAAHLDRTRYETVVVLPEPGEYAVITARNGQIVQTYTIVVADGSQSQTEED